MNNLLVMLHIRGLVYRIMSKPRKLYHKHKALYNTNIKPTIICNNCTAGYLLHDLSLQFRTPTINTLFYSFDEFFLFVRYLKEIQYAGLQEMKTEYKYPVAKIVLRNGEAIRVGFVHYHSFEEACQAWKRRFQRVNYDNLYVIYEGRITEADVRRFSEISYPKAILYRKDKILEQTYNYYNGFEFYDKWYPGIIGNYTSLFSLRRYLDEFDYISFLNQDKNV